MAEDNRTPQTIDLSSLHNTFASSVPSEAQSHALFAQMQTLANDPSQHNESGQNMLQQLQAQLIAELAAKQASPPTLLDNAARNLKDQLQNVRIVDSESGATIPVPVEALHIKTGLTGTQESLHIVLEGNKSSELNQPAISSAAQEILSQAPTLASLEPVVHNWRDDTKLDIKYNLPEGVTPAAVAKEIAEIRTIANDDTGMGPHAAAVLDGRTDKPASILTQAPSDSAVKRLEQQAANVNTTALGAA